MPVVHKHGYGTSSYIVRYSRNDTIRWSKRWPGSSVRGAGFVEFGRNGDLIDKSAPSSMDGTDWAAFIADLQVCANASHAKERGWSFDNDNAFAKRHKSAMRRANRNGASFDV